MALPPLLAALGQLDAAGEPHAWARSEADCPESGKQLGNFRRGPDMPSLVELLREVDEQERSGGTRSIVLDHLAQPTYRPLAGGDGFLRQYGLQGGAPIYTPQVSGPFLASAAPYLSRIVTFAGAGGGGSINGAGPTATGSNGTALLRSSQAVSAPESLATTSSFSFATIDSSEDNFSTVEVEPALQTSPQAATSLSGDANGDRLVNLADYTLWRDNLGTSSSTADYDGSGSVDTADYTTWKQGFASTTASVAPSDVSEPVRGDANGDGAVNLADYTVWRDQLGSPGPAGDLDGSGVVDEGDYGVWREQAADSPRIDRLVVPDVVPVRDTEFVINTTQHEYTIGVTDDKGDFVESPVDGILSSQTVPLRMLLKVDGATTASHPFEVRVTEEGNDVHTFDGRVDRSTDRSANVTLSPGRHELTFTFERTDRASSRLPIGTISLFVDDAPPTITISPTPDDTSINYVRSPISIQYADSGNTNSGLTSIALTDNGTPVPLTFTGPAESLTFSYDFENQQGRHDLVLTATDRAGNSRRLEVTYIFDTRPPTVAIQSIPDPTNLAVNPAVILFDNSVTGVDIADFTLTRTTETAGIPVDLSGLTVTEVATVAGRYEIDLSTVTAEEGRYELTLVASRSGIQDLAGNGLRTGASVSWELDTTVATADIQNVAPDPRNTSVGDAIVQFSEVVTGVDLTDFELSRDGVVVSLAGATLTGSGDSRTLNLAAVPQPEGDYQLTLRAARSGIRDSAGNEFMVDAADTWVIDQTPPEITEFGPVSPGYRMTPAENTLAIEFSEPVSGFTTNNLRLTRDGQAVDLSSATLSPNGTTLASAYTLSGLESLTDATGNYTLQLDPAGGQVRDEAMNALVVGDMFSFAVDVDKPTISNFSLNSGPYFETSLGFNFLPVGLNRVTYTLDVRDLAPAIPAGMVRIEVLDAQGNTLPGQPPQGAIASLTEQTTVDFDLDVVPGPQMIQFRAKDLAGNETTVDGIEIRGIAPGDSTSGAPGTPAYTTSYFLGATLQFAVPSLEVGGPQSFVLLNQDVPAGMTLSINGTGFRVVNRPDGEPQKVNGAFNVFLETAINAANAFSGGLSAGEKFAWLRPWTNSFDKTTQTVWFTMEDGHMLGNIDPATGHVDLYNVNLTGGAPGLAVDPHGVFFDFNTHLTPRVWFVYRNQEGISNSNQFKEVARLAYFDVVTKQLYTYDFGEHSSEADSHDHLAGAHNIQVDATGTVWFTAEHSNAIVEVDFDFAADGSSTASLGSQVGRFIVHQLPAGLGGDQDFNVHGLKIVVDERTGDRFVWVSDAGGGGNQSGPSTGRVALLHLPAPPPTMVGAVPTQDAWYEWDFDAAFEAEGRDANGHVLFLEFDDMETPGIPEDDRIVVADPGPIAAGGEGVIRVIDPSSVIKTLKARQTLAAGTTSPVQTVRVPAPGGVAGTDWAAAVQAFVERDGGLFFVDSDYGVGRIDLRDPRVELSTSGSQVDAPVRGFTTNVDGANSIEMQLGQTDPIVPLSFTPTVEETLLGPQRTNLSDAAGINIYEVAAETERRARNPGIFRGTINASSVVYGSLSQSDHFTTTIFAETARRQMTAVPSPTKGDLALRGRMAFQVLSDGSIILTGRPDGSILDEQIRLTKLLVDNNKETLSNLKISGDLTAFVEPLREMNGVSAGGELHLYGKNEAGKIVHIEYWGKWSFGTKFSDPSDWQVSVSDALSNPSEVLSGDPRVAPDGKGVYITTSEGRLLYFHGSNLRSEPLDLTGSSPHRVYSRPAVVVEGATTYVYATNQRGQLIEFVHVTGAPGNERSAPDVVAPAGETNRALMMFQNVEAVLQDGARHIYGTDGTSRLVHYEITGGGSTRSVFAENVSQLAADSVDDSLDGGDTANDIAFGQFPFQEPYVGRVYSGLTVLAGKEGDGRQFVYGTNGSNLILFIRGDDSDEDQRRWTVADLTNDIFSIYGAAGSRERDVPSSRVPANSVFGSPGGYIEPDGDRHIFQINAEGEVIEYYIDFSNPGAVARFHTQNINLRTGNSPVTNLLLDADTMNA